MGVEEDKEKDKGDDGGMECPECGCRLMFQEGCVLCPACGWSKCG